MTKQLLLLFLISFSLQIIFSVSLGSTPISTLCVTNIYGTFTDSIAPEKWVDSKAGPLPNNGIVTKTTEQFSFQSPNSGSGQKSVKTCVSTQGMFSFSFFFNTLDVDYYSLFDPPFMVVDGTKTQWDDFYITAEWHVDDIEVISQLCFGIATVDSSFGYATFIVKVLEGTLQSNCSDESKCTTDVCDEIEKICTHTPITCNDNSECTFDYCDEENGCVFESLCELNDKCYTDSCNPIIGCMHSPINCNDNNMCTIDSCDSEIGCINEEKSCDDGNVCTVDSCDPLIGCIHDHFDCSDGLFCTIDSCDLLRPEGSQCVHQLMNCSASDLCKVATCDPIMDKCVETEKNCDDSLYCTIDSCDLNIGCVHSSRVCEDSDNNNPCTKSSCSNSKAQCEFIPNINCNDDNSCTLDSVNVTTNNQCSCSHSQINCDDGDECSIDQCYPQRGCSYSPKNCDDGNACTVDSCDTKLGCIHTNNCSPTGCTSVSDCNFGVTTVCDKVTCSNGVCLKVDAPCDDGNFCTTDICMSNGCFHLNNCH